MHVELYVTTGPAQGKRFTFDKPDCFLFGRAKDAHISLPKDLYVSRQHFFLEISPPECKLRDLHSKNGVFVNGVRYGGQTPIKKGIKQAPINEVLLKNGDEIIVGDTRISVSIDVGGLSPDSQLGTGDVQVRCALCKKDVSNEVKGLEKAALRHYACIDCRKKIVITHGTPPKKMFPRSSQTSSSIQSRAGFPVIEGFQILQRMGHGTMGTVYKAKEHKSGRLFAIKKFTPQIAVDEEKMRLLQRDIFIIQQLKHKHIVQFFGYKKVKNTLYFIFEFVEGITLRKLMLSNKGRVSLEEALPIFWGILDGLTFAHRARISARTVGGSVRSFEGIVHRELSPQNILLKREGKTWLPKITDFKLYKSFEEAGITSITSPEEFLGTPMYWPREHLTHYKHVSPAADVFSIAAIFYEMLTGSWIRDGFQALFNRCKKDGRLPSVSDYMHVIVTNPPVPIRKRYPKIPVPLAKVIDRALREQELPHDDREVPRILKNLRYSDAGAFREALIQAFKELEKKKVPKAQKPNPLIESESPANESGDSSSAIMYAAPQATETKDAALLVLDLAQSTEYIVDMGDTHFSTLIGMMLARVRNHPSSKKLFLLKGTGDGFLAAFHSIPAAFSLALSYLKSPVASNIHLRLALHWGRVKIGGNGDILGMEVHRVTRIESLYERDRILPGSSSEELPEADRILITQPALERLSKKEQARFMGTHERFHLVKAFWTDYELLETYALGENIDILA